MQEECLVLYSLGSICLELSHCSWKSLWRDVTESCICENKVL